MSDKVAKRKSIIFKDPRLKSQIFHLLIPFLLQELVVILTTLMSNLVLKWWGCEEPVIVGISNAFQVFFLYNAIAAGVCYVGNLFMSQHYGRGAIDEVQKDYYVLLKVAFVLGIIFFILVLAIPQYLLFFAEEASKGYAIEYLRWFSPIFLLISPTMINYVMMKNMRLAKYCTISSIVTFTLVLTFESISIFSLDPAHYSWALELAACSMAFGRICEFIFLFVIINRKCLVKFKFKEFIKNDPERFKIMARYGAPVVISKASWGMGFVMISIISNSIGGDILVAHGYMSTYQNIVTCLSNALGSTVAVLIGRELGANRLRKAEDHGSDITRLLLLMGFIEMATFMLFLPIAMFTTPGMSDEVRSLLVKVFLIQMAMFLPRSYNATFINGFFNAGGDTIYIMLVDGITAWATIVPLGYIGLHLNWDPLVIYSLIQLEELFKFPINVLRYRKKKWVNNITKKKGIVFNE